MAPPVPVQVAPPQAAAGVAPPPGMGGRATHHRVAQGSAATGETRPGGGPAYQPQQPATLERQMEGMSLEGGQGRGRGQRRGALQFIEQTVHTRPSHIMQKTGKINTLQR